MEQKIKRSTVRLSLELDPKLIQDVKVSAVLNGMSLTKLTERLYREHLGNKKLPSMNMSK